MSGLGHSLLKLRKAVTWHCFKNSCRGILSSTTSEASFGLKVFGPASFPNAL